MLYTYNTSTLIYCILSITSIIACQFEIDEVSTNEILALDISPSKISVADGVSTIVIDAYIPKNSAESKRTVIFTTNAGKFSSNGEQRAEVKADINLNTDSLIATARLIAPIRPIKTEIVARILDTAVRDSIEFEFAEAVSISLTNDVPAISSALDTEHPKEVFVEGTLRSKTGLASTGSKVNIKVYDELDNEILKPNLRNPQFSSNSNGMVSTYLSVGNVRPAPKFIKIIMLIEETEIQDEVIVDIF